MRRDQGTPLKYLIPFDHFVLSSPLPPEAVLQRLAAEVHIGSGAIPRSCAFGGRIDGPRFHVVGRPSLLGTVVLTGEVKADTERPGRSLIHVRALPPVFQAVVFALLFGLVLTIVALTAGELIIGRTTDASTDAYAALGIEAFFLVLSVVWFWAVLPRHRSVLADLFRTYEA